MCHGAEPHGTADSVTIPSPDSLRATFDLPSSPLCTEALELAYKELEGPIFNHSVRVFLYADWLAKRNNGTTMTQLAPQTDLVSERDMLFVACILHDIGTSDTCNGPQRFEVEGADCAAALLRKYAVAESELYQVWLAIALHTCGGIAERAGRLPLLVRNAVLLDFSDAKCAEMNALAFRDEIQQTVPRGLVERVLANAVVRQVLEKPGKAPTSSWPERLLKAHLADPRWDRDNPGF